MEYAIGALAVMLRLSVVSAGYYSDPISHEGGYDGWMADTGGQPQATSEYNPTPHINYVELTGAMWCGSNGANCLWSTSNEKALHGCNYCSATQCCYYTIVDARRECSQSAECKGFWLHTDGKYYVRGVGVDRWLDYNNYPTAISYVKPQYQSDYAMPCTLSDSSYSTGALGCDGGPCLDGNQWYPTEEAAHHRCAQVDGCRNVMKWVDGRYYLRRCDQVDGIYTEYTTANYRSAICEGEDPLAYCGI